MGHPVGISMGCPMTHILSWNIPRTYPWGVPWAIFSHGIRHGITQRSSVTPLAMPWGDPWGIPWYFPWCMPWAVLSHDPFIPWDIIRLVHDKAHDNVLWRAYGTAHCEAQVPNPMEPSHGLTHGLSHGLSHELPPESPCEGRWAFGHSMGYSMDYPMDMVIAVAGGVCDETDLFYATVLPCVIISAGAIDYV